MLALDNGDAIRGDASVASKVDYTLHGVVSATITQLADGQLGASEADLYAAIADATIVTTITLVNTDITTRTVNLYLKPSGGTSRRIIPKDFPLGAGQSLTTDGVQINVSETNLERTVYIKVLVNDTALATGDGKAYITIPSALNGMNLVDADAAIYTVSTSGTPTIQIHNLTKAVDMLSTLITLDENEYSSYTAATPPVIDGDHDDVATGDRIRVDVDVAGTGTKGLDVILTFQLP